MKRDETLPSTRILRTNDFLAEIETAADQECRQQQGNKMRKCDLYLKDFNVNLHSGAKLAISYDCFAENDDFDMGKCLNLHSTDRPHRRAKSVMRTDKLCRKEGREEGRRGIKGEMNFSVHFYANTFF